MKKINESKLKGKALEFYNKIQLVKKKNPAKGKELEQKLIDKLVAVKHPAVIGEKKETPAKKPTPKKPSTPKKKPSAKKPGRPKKKPQKPAGKKSWQKEVKDIQNSFNLSWKKALGIYRKRKVSEGKKEDVKDLINRFKAQFKVQPPNSSRDLSKDGKQPAKTKIKRKSPTYGKPGGAKRKYYYEYRMNRRDDDNQQKPYLEKGGKIDYALGSTFANLLINNGFEEKRGTMEIRKFYNPQKDMYATIDVKGRLVEVFDNEKAKEGIIDYSGWRLTKLKEFLGKNNYAKGGEISKLSNKELLKKYDKLYYDKKPIPMTLVNELEKRGIYEPTAKRMGFENYAKGGETKTVNNFYWSANPLKLGVNDIKNRNYPKYHDFNNKRYTLIYNFDTKSQALNGIKDRGMTDTILQPIEYTDGKGGGLPKFFLYVSRDSADQTYAKGGSIKEHLQKADSHLREVGTKLYENKNIREKAYRKEFNEFNDTMDELFPPRYLNELGYAKGGQTEKAVTDKKGEKLVIGDVIKHKDTLYQIRFSHSKKEVSLQPVNIDTEEIDGKIIYGNDKNWLKTIKESEKVKSFIDTDGGFMYAKGGLTPRQKASLKGVGFNWNPEQLKNISKIADKLNVKDWYYYGSGGGFEHIAFHLADNTVIEFNNEDQISMSKKKYKDLQNDYYYDEDFHFMGYYPNVSIDDNYENVSDIIKGIKDYKNWQYAYAKGGEIEKLYYQTDNVGKAKYTISYTDGTTHKDGSPFYGIKIFKNKKDLQAFIKDLHSKGYKYKYAKGGKIKGDSEVIKAIKKSQERRIKKEPHSLDYQIWWEWAEIPRTKRKLVAIEAGESEYDAKRIARGQDWGDVDNSKIFNLLLSSGIIKEFDKIGFEVRGEDNCQEIENFLIKNAKDWQIEGSIYQGNKIRNRYYATVEKSKKEEILKELKKIKGVEIDDRYAKGGEIIKGFNPKNFSLDEIDSKLISKDILLQWVRKGDSTYSADKREFVWGGDKWDSKYWKQIKDKRFTMSDYGQIEMDRGSENLYFTVVIYELDGSDEPLELQMYSKDNHKDLKSFANNFISKMRKGGEIDYFEHYDKLPTKARAIHDKYQDKILEGDYDYKDSEEFLKEMEAEGYTFEYGLDNEPYDLRKMAKGGKIYNFPTNDFSLNDQVRYKVPYALKQEGSIPDYVYVKVKEIGGGNYPSIELSNGHTARWNGKKYQLEDMGYTVLEKYAKGGQLKSKKSDLKKYIKDIEKKHNIDIEYGGYQEYDGENLFFIHYEIPEKNLVESKLKEWAKKSDLKNIEIYESIDDFSDKEGGYWTMVISQWDEDKMAKGGEIAPDNLSQLYDRFYTQYPFATDGVAYFMFGYKENDNVVANAIKENQNLYTPLSDIILDYEYNYYLNMGEINDEIKELLEDHDENDMYAEGGEISDSRQRVAEFLVQMDWDNGKYHDELGENVTIDKAIQWELTNNIKTDKDAQRYIDKDNELVMYAEGGEITDFYNAAKQGNAKELSKLYDEADDLIGRSFTFKDTDNELVEIFYDKDQKGIAIKQGDEIDDISISGMRKLMAKGGKIDFFDKEHEKKWNNSSIEEREKILSKTSFSDKYKYFDYKDLTTSIKEKLKFAKGGETKKKIDLAAIGKKSRNQDFETTLSYLTIIKPIFWSWGVSKVLANKEQRWLRLTVNAHNHKGYIYLFLNGSDLYDVYYTSNQNNIKKVTNDLYFDQLQEVIDNEIEKQDYYSYKDGGFIAKYGGNSVDIQAKNMNEAKEKAIKHFKVPKSREGYVAVMSQKAYDNKDFMYFEKGGKTKSLADLRRTKN